MTKKVFNPLKEWKRSKISYRYPLQSEQENSVELENPTEELSSSPQRKWRSNHSSTVAAPVSRCQIVSFTGNTAECVVVLDGLELPKVGFPAAILRQKGLKVGSRFHWIMRDGARIRSTDIDANVLQTDEMTPTALAQLERHYEAFKAGLAEDGGIWPEHTGSSD